MLRSTTTTIARRSIIAPLRRLVRPSSIRVLSTTTTSSPPQTDVDFWKTKTEEWLKFLNDDYEQVTKLRVENMKNAAWVAGGLTCAGYSFMQVIKGRAPAKDGLDLALAMVNYVSGPLLAGCSGALAVGIHANVDDIRRLRVGIDDKREQYRNCYMELRKAENALKKQV